MPTNVTAKRLANPKAVHYLKNKALLPAFSYADVLAYEHAIAFSVAKMMNADLLADTQNALTQALDNGTPFSEFKKQIKPYLMAKGWWGEQVMTDPKDGQRKTVQLGSDRRLKTIYETNLSAAYAQGRWQAIQANKHLLPYLQYMPSVSKKKRDEHKGYYGLIRPVDDPIWQIIYPPNGFGCKCWVKSLTQKEAQALLAKQDTPHHLPKISEHNPRRGVNVETIAGTEGSFASNGDRLSALLKVAEQKHGADFLANLKIDLKSYMVNYAKGQGVRVVDFGGIKPTQKAIERLLIDKLDNKPKLNEAVAGAEYEIYHNVTLKRPEPVFDNGNPQAGFDYLITDDGKRLDFMYAMHGYPDKKIEMLNKFFAHTDEVWQKKKEQIVHHLDKADIVPIDLRYLSIQNTVKLVSFVLSLSKEQQSKIVFITGG